MGSLVFTFSCKSFAVLILNFLFLGDLPNVQKCHNISRYYKERFCKV